MFRNLPRFEYLAPKTLKECIALLSQYGQKAKVMAGGTDLIPRMRWGEEKPECLISLSQIPNLDEIRFNPAAGLILGALATIGEIERSEIIKEHYPLLAQAASVLGSLEVRNRGTVGGNLCNAAPSADMAPSLLVLSAKAVTLSERGERSMPLEDFFRGPKKTVLEGDEILIRIEISPRKSDAAGAYIKLGRRNAMEIALIGVAAWITLGQKNNIFEEAKLALASASHIPLRAKEAEGVLAGRKIDQDVIDLAAKTASKEASPRTSWRTTEPYRREMIRVLTRRAIYQALDKIRS